MHKNNEYVQLHVKVCKKKNVLRNFMSVQLDFEEIFKDEFRLHFDKWNIFNYV